MLEKIKQNKVIIIISVVLVFVVREILIRGIIKGGLLNFKKAQEESNNLDKKIAENLGRADELQKQNDELDKKVPNVDEDWHKRR